MDLMPCEIKQLLWKGGNSMLTGKSANNLLIEVNKSDFCNVLWLQILYPLIDKKESNGKREGVNLNWQQFTNKTYKRLLIYYFIKLIYK